jgi:hypothetical protein
MAKELLLVDVGGVLVPALVDGRPTGRLPLNEYVRIDPIPGALEGIKRLRQERFGPRGVIFFTNCPKTNRMKSRLWLKYHNFTSEQGIPDEFAGVEFCDDWEGKRKIGKKRQATHVVDNHLSVLRQMYEVPHRYILNLSERELENPFYGELILNDLVYRAESWPDLTEAILKSERS